MSTAATYRYPELRTRVQSSFIDLVLIIALMFVISALLEDFAHVPDWVRISLFVGLFVIYEPICITLGCTLGNFLMGIRVRSATDPSKRINLLQAFVRYPIKIVLGWISFLTIHSNPMKRAIHDLAAGSVMVSRQ